MVRDYNRWLVLERIKQAGSISRVELARSLSLSNTAISKITAQLIDQGLVVEIGPGAGALGRKPQLLAINAGAGFILGFDLSPVYEVWGGIADLTGQLLHTRRYPLPSRQPEVVADAIAAMARELCSLVRVEPDRTLGLGISAVGVVDYAAGVVVQSANMGWHDVPLGQLVAERVGRPVTVDWMCNALALAEWRHGSRDAQASAYAVVGVGIGAALMFDGQIFRGTAFNAGEFGHTVVMANGPRCSCGNWGCIEALCSHRAMVAHARALVSEGARGRLAEIIQARGDLRMEGVVEAHVAGDETAGRVIRRAGHYFGVGVTNLVNLLNIQRVVVRFDYPDIGPAYLAAAREVVAERALRHMARSMRAEQSTIGPEAVMDGTIQIVLQQLFRNPTVEPKSASVTRPVWQY